jgi:hypothetical protein
MRRSVWQHWTGEFRGGLGRAVAGCVWLQVHQKWRRGFPVLARESSSYPGRPGPHCPDRQRVSGPEPEEANRDDKHLENTAHAFSPNWTQELLPPDAARDALADAGLAQRSAVGSGARPRREGNDRACPGKLRGCVAGPWAPAHRRDVARPGTTGLVAPRQGTQDHGGTGRPPGRASPAAGTWPRRSASAGGRGPPMRAGGLSRAAATTRAGSASPPCPA